MLRAGVAQVDITPPVGTELCGYSARPGPAAGVHDPLYARALVLDDGATRAAIVTTDLIGYDHMLVEGVRADLPAGSVLPEHVLLTATHTHAGPMVSCLSRMGQVDKDYLRRLQAGVVRAVVEAAGCLAPATVGAAVGQVQIGVNRRQRTDGGVTIGVNPAGPVDRDLAVLAVRGDGGPMAILLNHACHGTTQTGENLLITADWPGAAAAELAAAVPGAVVMVANGCCGDNNPEPRGEWAHVAQHGHTIASAAQAVLPTIEYADRPLRVHSRPVTIPLQPMPALERAQELYDEAVRALRAAEGGDSVAAKRTARGVYGWAADLLRYAQEGAEPPAPTSEIMALSLGDIGLVGLPGEPFCELGTHIKAASPFPTTLVLGYAGAVIGYLPTARAFEEGGYEVEGAARWYGVCPLSPETQRIIEETALAALHEVA